MQVSDILNLKRSAYGGSYSLGSSISGRIVEVGEGEYGLEIECGAVAGGKAVLLLAGDVYIPSFETKKR